MQACNKLPRVAFDKLSKVAAFFPEVAFGDDECQQVLCVEYPMGLELGGIFPDGFGASYFVGIYWNGEIYRGPAPCPWNLKNGTAGGKCPHPVAASAVEVNRTVTPPTWKEISVPSDIESELLEDE